MNVAVPSDHSLKIKEIEKGDKYLELAKDLKNIMKHKGHTDTNFNWCGWNITQ